MLVCRVQHLVLDVVDQVAGHLDRRKIAVDDGIDQRVGEIVGAAGPQSVGRRTLDALAHGIERISLTFLEGNDEILAEEHGDLFVTVGRDVVDHAHDDEGVVLEEIDLRPLAGVDDVFQSQRMQVENPADLLDQLDVGEARTVQPDDRPVVAMGIEIVDAGIVSGLEFLGRDQGQPELAAVAPPDQRSACPARHRPAVAASSPAPAFSPPRP